MVDAAATDWPAHWEADVTTADGGTVRVRPVTPADGDRLVAFHGRQSPESIYFRFFSARPTLSAADVRRFTHVDLRDRVAFVALLDDDLVGIGRYDRYRETDEAEVAFFIDDAHHGRGLATILLEYLAAAARDNGIHAFVATVLPSNRAMQSVFHQAGFETASRFADGVIEVRFEVAPTPASEAAVEDRASRSDARTVARLLEPRSVAVIGAGRRRGTIGHEVLRQLLDHDFAGPVYPVNREAAHVGSSRAWPSILDVPDHVDLAVIAVPAPEVLDAVEECARARVGALVVVSTGFSEAGEEGLERARALVALAHRHGIRVLGPGSFGAINTAPTVRLHASFASVCPHAGRVALSLQSGMLGAGIIGGATAKGLGFSSVVAVGDKLDVSGNDLLAWWEHDERTDVILLSLDSYGNPRRFRRIAPRVSRRKPIVAVIPDPARADDALLAQTGVVAVPSLDAMLDVARVLAWQPVPTGDRVGILTDSAGASRFAAGACTAAGLKPAVTVTLAPDDAEPARFGEALAALLHAESPDDEPAGTVDAVLVVYSTALAPRPDEAAAAVAAAAATTTRIPVVASFPGHDLGGGLPAVDGRRVPEIGFPDAAARALGAAVRYGAWCRHAVGELPALDGIDVDAAAAAVTGALEDGATSLSISEVVRVLTAVGLSVAAQGLASSAEEAARLADEVGAPVAMKAVNRSPGAKSEAAGVALDLQSPDDVVACWSRLAPNAELLASGAVVQAMVPPGVDLRVVLEPAPVVGASIGLGPGGAAPPDAMVPLARAVLPLTDATAADLLARSGMAALLDDRASSAVIDLLLRVSVLAEDVPYVEHVALNPVIVSDGTAWITDATVGVTPDPDAPPDDLRRLD